MKLEGASAVAPLAYVELLEKATQIAALTYSNNKSVNLHSLLASFNLPFILDTTTRIALYSHDLKQKEINRFLKNFVADLNIHKLQLREISGTGSSLPFFTTTLHTSKGHCASARATKLHRTLLKLAASITHDLIPQEYAYASHGAPEGHHLLKIANELHMISAILNPHFIPKDHIFAPEPLQNKDVS